MVLHADSWVFSCEVRFLDECDNPTLIWAYMGLGVTINSIVNSCIQMTGKTVRTRFQIPPVVK